MVVITSTTKKRYCIVKPFMLYVFLLLALIFTLILFRNQSFQPLDNVHGQTFILSDFTNHGGMNRDVEKEKDKAFIELKAKSMAYIQRFDEDSFTRPLSFFHIPKTAGTAIEHAAGQSELKTRWGSCMFNHKRKRDDCEYPYGAEWPDHIGWWHLPSHFFPLGDVNPYKESELFGVIRNPYDRMVSEFYYICTLKVFPWRPDQCDRTRLYEATYLNEWLQEKMQQQNRLNGSAYLMDNGHFTPQHDFIFGPHQVRMLDYVLTMDNKQNGLADQFNLLMNAFQLEEIQLVKFNALGAADRETESMLDVQDLSKSTVDLIKTQYKDDFALGNYAL